MVKLWTLNALIVVCIAFVLFIVSFSTPYWLEKVNNDPSTMGLWQICTTSCYQHHYKAGKLLLSWPESRFTLSLSRKGIVHVISQSHYKVGILPTCNYKALY